MSEDQPLVSVESRGDALVVAIHAESFNSANAAAVQSQIEAAVAEAPVAPVAVDLGEVAMLTSAGIGVLVRLHTGLRGSNRRLSLCGARGEVAVVLRLARLDHLLDLYPSVGEFLLHVRSARSD